MTFQENYSNLLILQYSDKPKAKASIEALCDFGTSFNTLYSLPTAFDIDLAMGVQLDVIGRIVGLNRTVPFSTAKVFFGFKDIPNTLGFGKAPFRVLGGIDYTDTQLSDSDYRFLLKAKIAKNHCKGDIISISKAINFIFNGKAFAVDNEDMTLTFIIADIDADMRVFNYALILDLIPRPAGVGIKYYIQQDIKAFGFRDTPNCLGFGLASFAQRITI